jgi:cyclase
MRTRFSKVALLAVAGIASVLAQPAQQTAQPIQIVPVKGNIYMLAGAGGNIVISVGPDGVLLVDSGLAANADRVLAAINSFTQEINKRGMPLTAIAPPKPIRYIINTHFHGDHTGGNEKIAKAGRTFTGGNVIGDLGEATEGAAIVAHENVLTRMSAKDAKIPVAAWPTESYYREQMKLSHFFNNEGVQLIHIANAHTDGDSMVWFRGSDVIATGDVFVTTSYPFIDTEHGGSIQGELAALNYLLDIVIPEFRTEGGTMIVPGHGRICDTADVAYYRDMVTITRDRVQDGIKKGKTLDQIKASKPTADWDPRYGNSDRFIEAIYKGLTQKK